MTKCASCGNSLILEHDNDGWDTNHWENLFGEVYCDQCFYELYTVPFEKAVNNQSHNDKRVRARAEKKIKTLEELWGKL